MIKINIESDYVTGVNEVSFSNSLNAPLIYLKLKVTSETVIPTSEDLIINIDSNSITNPSGNIKTYIIPNVHLVLNDEFIIENNILNNNINMVSYIKNGTTKKDVSYEPINTLEGQNYLYTNYENISIELIYPENNDLNKRYILNSLFNESAKDSSNDLGVFTKSVDGISLSVNNVEANCITNPANKFSIDDDGNITAKTITLEENTVPISYTNIFDKIYPVGSIYISVNNINPGTIFTGTWESFGAGKSLIGVNRDETEFDTVEKTGGNKSHSHQVPSHSHAESDHYHTLNDTGFACIAMSTTGFNQREISATWNGNYYKSVSGNTTGGSTRYYGTALGGTTSWKTSATYTGASGDLPTNSANNLPPYITCYMWKRIS